MAAASPGGILDGYPDINLRLDATNEPTDIARESVDVDIRHGEGNWPGLFVEGITEERFLPVCHPGLCPHGSLTAEELPRFRLIHSVRSQIQWAHWFGLAGVSAPPRWRRVLFCPSSDALGQRGR
ncbi:LysR substrate-binding domain-containing protein [Roseomonas sp. GCM10028921]